MEVSNIAPTNEDLKKLDSRKRKAMAWQSCWLDFSKDAQFVIENVRTNMKNLLRALPPGNEMISTLKNLIQYYASVGLTVETMPEFILNLKKFKQVAECVLGSNDEFIKLYKHTNEDLEKDFHGPYRKVQKMISQRDVCYANLNMHDFPEGLHFFEYKHLTVDSLIRRPFLPTGFDCFNLGQIDAKKVFSKANKHPILKTFQIGSRRLKTTEMQLTGNFSGSVKMT